jgi:hypothetical protein
MGRHHLAEMTNGYTRSGVNGRGTPLGIRPLCQMVQKAPSVLAVYLDIKS